MSRVERTLFTLEWLQSPELRQRVQLGLNKGEAKNALARTRSNCFQPAALPPLLKAEGRPGDNVQHIAFYIDAELDKACNLHVAHSSALSFYPRHPIPVPFGRQTSQNITRKTMNDKADPQTTEQLNALSQKYDEALNKNDEVALVATFTEDGAVFVTDTGPIYGRKAIEKWYADAFQQWHPKNMLSKPDQDSPHITGTTGNQVWSHGEWSQTLYDPNGDPIQVKGYWGAVAVLTWNITPAPAVPSWRPE
jgi:ketosteroid isomerase-like protein